jgi:hypothetical protein
VDGAVVCDIGSLAANEQVSVTVMVTMGTYGPQRVFEFGSTVTTTSSEANPVNNVGRAAVALQLPNVRAGREGDQPTVFWPLSVPGLQLEATSELQDLLDLAAWLGIPEELIFQEGPNHVFRPWTWMGSQGFYRLRPEDPPTPSLELYQQSIVFDSVLVPFSDWGRADITFVPQAGVVQYFNLGLPCPEGSGAKGGGQQTNECWPVQNLPLVTNGQTNRPTRVSVNFRWGTNGVLITNDIGWSLTTNMLFSPPQTTNFMYVAPLTTRVGTGFKGLPTTWWPATPLTGGGATNVWTAKPSFPNAEQGVNQSVPASVMNSMNYLKTYLGVTNLPRTFINITNMMAATGWEPGGAPQGGFGFDSWVDKKKAFMQQLNIQIQTIETNKPIASRVRFGRSRIVTTWRFGWRRTWLASWPSRILATEITRLRFSMM